MSRDINFYESSITKSGLFVFLYHYDGRQYRATFEARVNGSRWKKAAVNRPAGTSVPDPAGYGGTGGRRWAQDTVGPDSARVPTLEEGLAAFIKHTWEDDKMGSPTRGGTVHQQLTAHLFPFLDRRDELGRLVVAGARRLVDETTSAELEEIPRIWAGYHLDLLEVLGPQPEGVTPPRKAKRLPLRNLAPPGPLLSIEEASHRCNKSVPTLRRMCTLGVFTRATTEHGQWRIPTGDLINVRLLRTDGQPVPPLSPSVGLAFGSQSMMISATRAMFAFFVGRGWCSHNVASNMNASHPIPDIAKRSPNRKRFRVKTLDECKAIASFMGIHDQLMFWLMRVAGLRVSEAHGLTLEDFTRDRRGRPMLRVGAQAGSVFVRRDGRGVPHEVLSTEDGKSWAASRDLPIADALADFADWYIAIFHPEAAPTTLLVVRTTSSDAVLNANLLYRYKTACRLAEMHPEGRLGFKHSLHSLRGDCLSELGHDGDEVAQVTTSEYGGHEVKYLQGGAELTARHYASHLPANKAMFKAAAFMEGLIQESIGDLFAPIAPGAPWACSEERLGEREVALLALHGYATTTAPTGAAVRADGFRAKGWPAVGSLVTFREAASRLDVAPTTIYRWVDRNILRDVIIDGPHGEPVRRLEATAVATLGGRLFGRHTLNDAAEKLNLDYMTLYQRHRVGTLRAHRCDILGELVIDDSTLGELVAERDRLSRLASEALTLNEVAALYRTSRSTVRYWADKGYLTFHAELGPYGNPMITRQCLAGFITPSKRKRAASVADPAEASSQREAATAVITMPLDDARRILDVNTARVRLLVDQGVLERRQIDGRFHVTLKSVQAALADRCDRQ